MKIFYLLNNERGLGVVGFLALVFVITTTVAGTGGYLAIRVAQQEGQIEIDVLNDIIEDQPVSDERFIRANTSRVLRVQILVAGGSLVNSADPTISDAGPAIAGWVGGVTGNYVDQASNPRRPSSNKPLPRCMSGTFTCANGKIICANEVCNNNDNCGDNSDESSNICGTESSCCQSTNGCPGETGTSCAETCCCCPLNMICDRRNPANGCIRVR